MKVYKQEKIDGLEDLIVASQVYKFSSPIQISNKKPENVENLPILASVINQKDLFAYNSILCTVGEPNGNDIYFLPSEVLPVKDSPINKQVNTNHTDDVVGHMVASYVVDDNYNAIEVNPDEPPEYFHVLVESVIYTEWKEEERQKEIDKLVAEIINGDWSVSLECLAPDFSYLFIDEQKNISLIERTEQTAYLTKHLRMFNGDGTFNGKRIYCAPKNMWFSGKGLTKNPANLKSVILSEKNEDVYLNVDENNNSFKNNLGENIMTEDERKQLIKDIKEALSLNVTAGVSELKEGFDFKAAFDALNTVVAGLIEKVDTFVKSQTDELAKVKAELEVKTVENTALTASLESVKTENTTFLANLATERSEKTSIVRLAKLIKAGLDEVDAKAFVETTIALTDEQFDTVASKLSAPVVASKKDDIETIENAEPETAPVKVVASEENKPTIKDDFTNFWASGNKSK